MHVNDKTQQQQHPPAPPPPHPNTSLNNATSHPSAASHPSHPAANANNNSHNNNANTNANHNTSNANHSSSSAHLMNHANLAMPYPAPHYLLPSAPAFAPNANAVQGLASNAAHAYAAPLYGLVQSRPGTASSSASGHAHSGHGGHSGQASGVGIGQRRASLDAEGYGFAPPLHHAYGREDFYAAQEGGVEGRSGGWVGQAQGRYGEGGYEDETVS
ncbi:hypothetical protein BJ912DRAFT_456235 [Pholiota molesta]|nr:hypothetical protein BJ912DRAFT_456235 [Pholiota molesta]